MNRLQRLAAMALVLLAGAYATAGRPFPAVDLPPHVPGFVRDHTARSMAHARDTLGWTVHPFRGEFHGLGVDPGRSSRVWDLSANGRVVIGADAPVVREGSIYIRIDEDPFVWTPWTGRANYELPPSGSIDEVYNAVVSGDGVYVAGHGSSPTGVAGFRWSLAGRELIEAPGNGNETVDAISGNGSVVIGTATPKLAPGIDASLYAAESRAYRTSHDREGELLPTPAGFARATAVDVSSDGSVTLGNVQLGLQAIEVGRAIPESQPLLWRDGSPTLLGGPPRDGFPRIQSGIVEWYSRSRETRANALSADGSTVVGVETLFAFSYFTDAFLLPERRAVLWREESGWIDLGELQTTSTRRATDTSATDVSGDGTRVIGFATLTRAIDCSSSCGVDRIPFLWDEPRGMRELADVLRLDYGLGFDGWDLGTAVAISDDGTTIIGNGFNPDGVQEAWRAVLHRNTRHGDIDFDGDVDQTDYQRLIGNLGVTADDGAVFYADGDLNADGRIDHTDADELLASYRFHDIWRGDFNADGLVDAGDYSLWRKHLGMRTRLADSDGDGWVTEFDLATWRRNYGMKLAGVPYPFRIPEPSAALLALLGAPALARRRSASE